MTSTTEQTKFLHIYIRDHFAGSTAGTHRSARLAAAEVDSNDAPALAKFAADVVADREALATVLKSLNVAPSRMKAALASIAEKLGTLKLNGRIVNRSPLSTIVELELMQMAVRGKRALWETLKVASPQVPVDLDELIVRADDQYNVLHDLHAKRVASTFSARPG